MERYISIKEVLDNLLDNPLLQDLTLERVVNYTVDFIRKVGMPKVYIEKTANLEIKEYRALLPCDFYKMIQVRVFKEGYSQVFRSSTDSFHLSKDKGDSHDLTYKLQGQAIYTSMKNGTIEIVYQAIPVDCDGYPMILDNSSFREALELYITKKRYKVLFDVGKIRGDVYSSTCQDYAFAVGQAQTSLIMPTIDEMESITNSWNTLIPRVREHSFGFINNGSKEELKF
ncbi:tail tubular protein [uncultured phage cr116_1]|uniref:Tail tubular protein n=1 Tax=uncultured phage cr116_1 TaxID=2772073 RepID=A0A7M1RY76_9CAUD|nr:tail tubular protein [uncultured phage cr116_1]QOR59403.1 tail tubular protein [uncultured phage cr116_1]DAK53113.1 MAG TPA: hypothetical protein [Crassvirales sp.]